MVGCIVVFYNTNVEQPARLIDELHQLLICLFSIGNLMQIMFLN